MRQEKPEVFLETLLHVGIPTFMKLPFVYPKKEELEKAKADIAILGAPFEGCCVSTSGASFGPRMIRLATDSVTSYNLELDIDILEHVTFVDCGDVRVVPGTTEVSHERIREAVSEIIEAGTLPIIMGGDHSITFAAFQALHEHVNGKIGLIQFDTHFDCADTYGGERISNCTPIKRIAELKKVDPQNIVQIGIRGLLNPRQLKINAEELGIKTFYMWDILRDGIEKVTREAVRIAKNGTDALYVTVDIDVLDAAYAPATSSPSPGGLTSRQLIEAVRIVGKAGVSAFDLAEVLGPHGDVNNITARVAANIILEMLGAYVKEHRCG